uniref:ANK_REP_REGION domain-containing protein n=1 Tax=Macrostomum lignano TaxID=282301 RepID=A0A1I8F7I1_9PLAT
RPVTQHGRRVQARQCAGAARLTAGTPVRTLASGFSQAFWRPQHDPRRAPVTNLAAYCYVISILNCTHCGVIDSPGDGLHDEACRVAKDAASAAASVDKDSAEKKSSNNEEAFRVLTRILSVQERDKTIKSKSEEDITDSNKEYVAAAKADLCFWSLDGDFGCSLVNFIRTAEHQEQQSSGEDKTESKTSAGRDDRLDSNDFGQSGERVDVLRLGRGTVPCSLSSSAVKEDVIEMAAEASQCVMMQHQDGLQQPDEISDGYQNSVSVCRRTGSGQASPCTAVSAPERTGPEPARTAARARTPSSPDTDLATAETAVLGQVKPAWYDRTAPGPLGRLAVLSEFHLAETGQAALMLKELGQPARPEQRLVHLLQGHQVGVVVAAELAKYQALPLIPGIVRVGIEISQQIVGHNSDSVRSSHSRGEGVPGGYVSCSEHWPLAECLLELQSSIWWHRAVNRRQSNQRNQQVKSDTWTG